MKGVLIFFILLFPLIMNAQIISTVAGTGTLGYNGDGIPATTARLHLPGKAIFDANGNLFIADTWGERVRRVDAITDTISTVAGTGVAGYNGDSIAATAAQLNDPVGLAFDSSGNLYICDVENWRVRKVNMATGIITTFAGNGLGAYSGDGGPATNASFLIPGYVAIDAPHGNMYIGDSTRVRKIDLATNIITTYAGNGSWGYSGDGFAATTAEFNFTEGVAVDGIGNLFICDTNGTVRKVNASSGIITTFAGIGISGYTGDGLPATAAKILNPFDVCIDGIGDCYIAEFKGRIREVDTFGIILTVAGTTVYGYNGDGIPATTAELNETTGVTTDACGSLYIADASNERIRKVTYPAIYTIPTITLTGTSTAPAGITVTVNATVSNAGSSYDIYWYNNGALFATTTTPTATYTQTPGADTITAMVVPTGYGCYDSSTSAPHVVTAVSTGIQSAVWGVGVQVYPNPASNVITVAANNNISNITITNLMGQTVYNLKKCQFEHVPIDVSGFPAGVYFVDITDEEGNKTVRKIVKE